MSQQQRQNTTENLRLNALKAISNLIYNSKFAQDFYIINGVAEMIAIYLKQFTPSEILNNETTNMSNSNDALAAAAAAASARQQLQLSVSMFNLRILFLLTVFSRELRLKLREKLQVITYLIEIIDQVMKERLNGVESPAGSQASFSLGGENTANDNNISSNNGGNNFVAVVNFGSADHLLAAADYCLLKPVDVEFIIEILKILYNLTMDMAANSKVWI